MTRPVRLGLAALVAVAVTAATAALSRVPYAAERAEHAVVRLSWRARGERVEECRRRSPEELAELPPHMRLPEVCEGRVLPYHLRVWIDGRPVVDRVVHASGAREDRPLYVFHELPVSPGAHRVSVSFTREGAPPGDARGGGPTPARLALDARLALVPGDVALVTYDAEARRLVAAGRGVAKP